MNGWNKLQALLDAMFGFPNKVSSKVRTLQEGFNNKTQEHVIWFEYRVKVSSALPLKPDPRQQGQSNNAMALMRELRGLMADRPA